MKRTAPQHAKPSSPLPRLVDSVMADKGVVYLIDEDESTLTAVGPLLQEHGYCVKYYASGIEFLAAVQSLAPGCIVTDMYTREINGPELLRALKARNLNLPVIVASGHSETPLVVKAMKAGATDFIEKPFSAETLIEAISAALQTLNQATGEVDADLAEIRHRIASLTPREDEVMDQLVLGCQTKIIAYNLGMSPRTVEVHRSRVMEKLRVSSIAELVRMAITAGHHPQARSG